MQYLDQSNRWRNTWFVLRVGLSCFLVPATVPVTFALHVPDSSPTNWIELLEFLPMAAFFGSPAMIFVGIPLLYIYLRRGWTGFLPFLIGGGVCGIAIFGALLSTPLYPVVLRMYAACGLVGGALFRILLFGFTPVLIGERRN